ncbi:allantoate transport protein [Paraphaeosphaeria sporulosa]
MASPEEKRPQATPDSPQDPESGASSLSLDKDVAIKLVGEHAQEIDPEIEKRVLRKIDLFLIPAMIVGYGLVYYDKAILGSAVLFGMTKDLSLSVVHHTTPPTTDTKRLSWATSLFYFGMLAGLYPMTFALQRFNLGRILGGVVIVWALICMLTAAVTTWRGLYAQRFFLGFFESVIPTGFMCIVSGYYTQEEQALRQSWWFSSTGLFTIIGGALNYGFAQITGGALKRWQYIYILAGCLTFLFGIFCFFIPNSPVEAWFLTTEEKVVAVERLRKGQTGVRCQKIKMAQVKEALLDVKLWLIFVMMGSAYTVNGAVSGFGPLIVSTFGWSTLESILWQFPLGGLCFFAILACGWASARFQNIRIILLIINCLPVIAGCAMIWKGSWTYHAGTPVAGYSIIGTFGAVVSLTIVTIRSNVAGATKKSVMAGSIFVAYCVGNIVGPQLIKSETKKDHYPELWTGLIISYCITIVASVALYVVLWRENKKREGHSDNEEERDRLAFLDLTDGENPYFRYVL